MTDELSRRIFELAMTPDFRERYKVDRALGRGAMGVVLSGEQVSTGRRVAVKFMIELDDPVAVARMEREGQLLARVAHPGLTRILDAGTVGGYPYLVTELMTGDTLDDRIQKRGRLPLDEAMQVCREVLPALQACHDANVVHRDLKPQNILYDHEGRARLADLGVARWVDATKSLTTTGQVIGTPLYVAPELLRAELATPASDIYGIGCTIFEMLVGQPPFEGPTLPELLKRQMHEAPPRADVLVPEVPTTIAEIVDRTLAKAPADRPASATELLEALEMAALSHKELVKTSAYVAPRIVDPHAAATHGAIPVEPPPRPKSRPDRPRPTGQKIQPVAEPPRTRLAAGFFVTGLVAGAVLLAMRPSTPVPATPRSPESGVRSPESAAPSSSQPASSLLLTDADAPLPPGAIGRIGSYWGSHPQASYLRLSPDGRFLATSTHNTVRIWDLSKKRLVSQWRSPLNYIGALEISAGGTRTAAGLCSERMTRTVNALAQTPENAPPLEIQVHGGKPRTIAGPSYCGAWALAPGAGFAGWFDALTGRISVLNLDDNRPIDRGAAVRPLAMAVSPDGQTIALVTKTGGELRGRDATVRPLPVAGASQVAWSPDGARLALITGDGLLVLDAASLRISFQVPGATSFVWEPSGRSLAVRTPDAIEVRAAKGATMSRHDATDAPFALAGDDLIALTGSGFQADAGTASRPRVLAVDPNGGFAVVEHGGLAAWHLDGRKPALAAAGEGWALAGIARDGRAVHLRQRRPAESDDLVRVVDATTGARRAEFPVPGSAIYLAMSDARGLLIHPNLSVEVPGPGGGRKLLNAARLDRPDAKRAVLCVLDRAERKLLLGHPERGLVMLDLLADELRTIWRKEMVAVTGLPNAGLFRYNAKEVVLSSSDEVLHLQDTQGAKPARVVRGPLAAIKCLAQSPDETRVYGGDAHGGIAAWDLPGGQVRSIAPMVGLAISSLGLDSNDRILAVDDDGVLTVWK